MLVLRRAAICIGFLFAGVPVAWGAADQALQPITLHYIQRPPYMVASGDELTGLTGAPAFHAFKKAAIPFEIKETPFLRQLRLLELNSGQDCMIGMFKKSEREVFAKFTKPIYRDQTQVILTSKSNAHRFASSNSVEGLFGDKGLVFLAKSGYSYGAALDARIEALHPVTRKTTDENLMMVKAIKVKMADYMIIAPDEASEAIVAAGFSDSDFKQIKLTNMPVGEYRHIMCSKNVPDEVIKKLNASMTYDK
jgi:ABC-type amino acid transport substrate-binding protein